MFKRFLKDTRGNIAMMFGILAIPLIATTGAAVDYSRAYEQRMIVQDALDAAALAANRLIGFGSAEEIRAEAEAFFQSNVAGRLDLDHDFNIVIDGGTVTLTTRLKVPTKFLGLVGIKDIGFQVTSRTIAGAATYEVVLVLDNSGSMSGSKITTLRQAATNLINSLFELSISNPAPDPVRVGIVPFAASVNVGPGYSNAAWMDTLGVSPRSPINFTTDLAERAADPTLVIAPNTYGTFTNRFALWNTLNNVTWRGCVEARPYPYDVTDALPALSIPATLFVPMFAPDNPGTVGETRNGFVNSWLGDNGGSCSGTTPTRLVTTTTTYPPCTGNPNSNGYRTCVANNPLHGQTVTTTSTVAVPLDDRQLQERVCKYTNVSVGTSYRGAGQGPNLNCTTTAVQALSNDRAVVIAQINAMQANGYTNIEEGVMWGWRALSPTAPFTEGREYSVVGNRKILIVMTDGANTYSTNSSINRSFYSAFSFIKHGFLGTTSNNQNTVVSRMNDRTIEACNNIRNTEIIVYTIAFEIPATDQAAIDILRDCASDPAKAFQSNNQTELLAAFQLIGQDIATLRIAE